MDKNEELLEKFSKVDPSMTCDTLKTLLGVPDIFREMTVPDNSGVGNQSGVWRKLNPGDQYLEWIYEIEGKELTIWFANVDGNWMPAMAIPIPKTPMQP